MLKVYGCRIFTHPYRLINNAASLCSSQHCFYGLPCPPIVEVDTQELLGLQLAHFFATPKHGYRLIWESQPYTGSTPAGNILISAAISYSTLFQLRLQDPFELYSVQAYPERPFSDISFTIYSQQTTMFEVSSRTPSCRARRYKRRS